MQIEVKPILVHLGDGPHEAQLVHVDGALVAVFSHFPGSTEIDSQAIPPGWFLEAGFGPCGSLRVHQPEIFASMDEALAWVKKVCR